VLAYENPGPSSARRADGCRHRNLHHPHRHPSIATIMFVIIIILIVAQRFVGASIFGPYRVIVCAAYLASALLSPSHVMGRSLSRLPPRMYLPSQSPKVSTPFIIQARVSHHPPTA
jgi:hypothetical protein